MFVTIFAEAFPEVSRGLASAAPASRLWTACFDGIPATSRSSKSSAESLAHPVLTPR